MTLYVLDTQAGLAWIGCFCSILLVGGIFTWIDYEWSLPLMLASFGPTAALLYSTPSLPAAQPWNAMGKITCHCITVALIDVMYLQ